MTVNVFYLVTSGTGSATIIDSNNSSITVEGVTGGTVTVTAMSDFNGVLGTALTADCTPVPVTGITLDSTAVAIPAGGTFQLTAAVEPANADNQGVTYTRDTTDLTVDGTGLITVGANPTVDPMTGYIGTITATSDEGEFKATCEVYIDAPIEAINFDVTSLILKVGESKSVFLDVYPPYTFETLIEVTNQLGDIFDFTLVEVNGVWNGEILITGVKAGTDTLTATSAFDSSITNSIQVTVTEDAVTSNSGSTDTIKVSKLPKTGMIGILTLGSGVSVFGGAVIALSKKRK